MRPFAKSLKEFAAENNARHLLTEYSINNALSPDEIGFLSKTPVKWVCAYGHEKIESPNARTRRGYCSVCGKLRHGSFAQNYPDMLKSWSNDNTVDPYLIPPTYSKPVLWTCDHGHCWSRSIKTQVKLRTCPYCSTDERRFFSLHPEMLEQWDCDRNGNTNPYDVFAYSHQVYFWICPNGHSYKASPEKLMRKSVRCPTCISAGYKRPDIIAEWHPTKNGEKTPFDFAANSQKVAWFICSVCGKEYTCRVANRVNRRLPNCPNCRWGSDEEKYQR